MTINQKNKTFQKFISCFLIIAILSPAGFVMFAKPPKTEAIFGIGDVNIQALDIQEIVWKVLEQVLMYVARKLLDKMTQSTINWINSGFEGKPLFIENPESFFRDIAKEQLRGFVDTIGYNNVSFPFGKSYALGLIDQAKGTFEQNATYSLSKMQLDSAEFENRKNNFSAGGWEGFLLNTQLPQNNFIGFGFLADEELENRLNSPTSPITKVKDTVEQGMGFLSPQACKSNPNWSAKKLSDGPQPGDLPVYDPGTRTGLDLKVYNDLYNLQVKTAKNTFSAKYGCPEGAVATTPGSQVANSIMTALGSKQKQGELGAALGNSLAALFDALINKFFNMGLTGINNLITPPPPKPLNEWNSTNNGTPIASPNIPGEPGYDPNNPLVSTNPSLRINVNVINDNGGTLNQGAVQVFVDGNLILANEFNILTAGLHVVSGTPVNGYSISIIGDCFPNGSITLALGESKYCDVVFDDVSSGPPDVARLTVRKIVINDNGGTLTPDVVQLFVDGNLRLTGVEYLYNVGLHTVSEDQVPGYVGTIGGDCAPDGKITLVLNDVKECTITNNDI